jgi:hypothetical protein
MGLFDKSKETIKSTGFLYFLLGLSIFNILGYLQLNRIDIIALFTAVALLVKGFTSNMVIILLTSLIFTNFYMAIFGHIRLSNFL